MRYQIQIQAGRLDIKTRHEDLPLNELLDFASRQNPKRGFLFVSKVLGKHIPCQPSQMRGIYQRLAAKLQNLPGPIVVIGMAETATGLGAGVADSLARAEDRTDVLYLHTTRHHLDVPVLIGFDENHSHAPDHILYAPQGPGAKLLLQARSLVLVDDEISTGRTLRLLAQGIAAFMPQLQQVCFSSIVLWLEPERQQVLIRELGRDIYFSNLLEGAFQFKPDPDYRATLPTGMDASRSSPYARYDSGRTGLLMPATGSIPLQPLPSGPLVVVGTGEFAFAPFLAAEELEQRGQDVLFQSTTRSPIMLGEAIRHKHQFSDEHQEGVTNYIYNLPVDRQVIVAYEHPAMSMAHDFTDLVDAVPWSLPLGITV